MSQKLLWRRMNPGANRIPETRKNTGWRDLKEVSTAHQRPNSRSENSESGGLVMGEHFRSSTRQSQAWSRCARLWRVRLRASQTAIHCETTRPKDDMPARNPRAEETAAQ